MIPHDMIPIARYGSFFDILWNQLELENEQALLQKWINVLCFKNSPKLAPNTKLTWKTHFLPIEPIKRGKKANEPFKLLRI